MLGRFRTAFRAANYKFGSFRRIPRTSASNYGRYTRQSVSLAGSSVALIAGAAGTIVLYKLTTSSKIFDGDSLSSYFANLLQQISPSIGCVTAQASEIEEKNHNLEELKARAEIILRYCMEKDSAKVEKKERDAYAARVEQIIEEMSDYVEQKKKGSGGTTETEKHLINDAIHGPIELSPLLYQIINTPEFHRLKDLRQLGATHYVYPGANHTRFEHSIGVAYVARRFAQSLQQQLNKDKDRAEEKDKSMYQFDDKEVLCAEMAGLCHDLGHGPFSHMFEKVMKEKLGIDVHHESLSVLIFKRMLANNPKLLAEFVLEGLTEGHVKLIGNMINPPANIKERDKRLFLYEIVANKDTGIDVDKWDYYQRDCHYLGILQDFQWRRTMLLGRIVMTPTEGYTGSNQLRIGFRDKEMENLYGMFRTRANIHRKACQHKTIKAVERMFIEAMDYIQDLQVIWVPSDTKGLSSCRSDTESKGTFKSIKKAVELAKDAETEEDPSKLSWYLAMTDSLVGNIMSADACTEIQQKKLDKAKQLLRRVEQRDLYTCSAKKRVPKFFHPLEYLPPDHPSRIHCQSCAKALKEDKDLEVIAALYDDHKKCRKFEQLVHDKLLNEEKSIIKEKDIWVEVVKIKHPSEKANNPVDEVLFFKKAKTPNGLPKTLSKDVALRKASMVCVPQAFVEYELRVYDKRSRAERNESHQKALETAMEKAWEAWPNKNCSNNQ